MHMLYYIHIYVLYIKARCIDSIFMQTFQYIMGRQLNQTSKQPKNTHKNTDKTLFPKRKSLQFLDIPAPLSFLFLSLKVPIQGRKKKKKRETEKEKKKRKRLALWSAFEFIPKNILNQQYFCNFSDFIQDLYNKEAILSRAIHVINLCKKSLKITLSSFI